MTRLIFRAAAVALLALATLAPAAAQDYMSKPYSYLSAASNNATLIYGNGPSLLQTIIAVNTTATVYYLKLYDKRTAPVCGTDTPVLRIPIPNNTSGGGALPIGTSAIQFANGIGFCLVANLIDSDNTVAATGVAINFGIVWQ